VVIALVALVTLAAAACTTPKSGGGGGGGNTGGGGPTTYDVTVIASSATTTYGTIPPITPTYVNLPSGQTEPPTPATCTTTATVTSPPGVYPTTCSGAAGTNETFDYVDASLTITRAPVVVTASSASSNVGEPIPPITASYSGLQNGDVASATLPICFANATSASPVGTYQTTCGGASDSHYTFTYAHGTLSVGKGQVTVTASSGSTMYGNPVPAVTASYSGFQNGQTAPATPPTCSTAASSSSDVGTYATSCSGASDANYNFVYVDGTDTVTRAPASIKASSGSFSFGFPVPPVTPTYSGLRNGDTAAATPPTCSSAATTSSPPGTYANTCSGADDPNYNFSYVAGTETVTAGVAPVTVTASSATITYGDAVPAITPSYSGFTGGQTVPAGNQATCTTTAQAGSPAGTYPTTCSGATDPGYNFAYVSGTVTIMKAPLTITASSGNMIYGGTVPTITASYTGLVNGDTAPATLPTCSTTATSTSNVGSYPSTCSGAVDSNYAFTLVHGAVNVTPAAATITASSGSFTYGGTPPTITPIYGGLLNGTTHAATAPTCNTAATSASPAGTYPSVCQSAGDPNYTFTYSPGTVTVNPKAATITASSATIVYFDAIPTITPVYSGLVNGNTGAANPPTCSTTATQGSGLGTYPSSCSGASDPSYTFSYAAGTVTINQAPATVTASNATITQGDATPTITPAYSGLRNGQSAPATVPTCSTSAGQFSPVGTYPSTCSGAADPNYSFSYVNGTVTVVAGPPTGYVAYGDQPTLATTTTAQVTTPTSAVTAFSISVAAATNFDNYENLAVQTTAGPMTIFCKVAQNTTTLSTCNSPNTSRTIPAGSIVTNANLVNFDVYTIIPGGKAAVQPSSVTIVSDVPAADRAVPTVVTGNATNAVVKYIPSTTVTGTFQLTFGYCNTGTNTYSASDPNCHTGFLKYGPTTDATMGWEGTVVIVTEDIYEKIGAYAVTPATIPHGTTFTAYFAPGSSAIPALQPNGSSDATVNSGKTFIAVVPIPAGMTYVSSKLTGGDELSSGSATTVSYCTSFTDPGCNVADNSSNYTYTTTPFIVVNSNITVLGGGGTTLPTVAVTLTATGASGTVANTYLTEFEVTTSAKFSGINVAVAFKGWPSDPAQPSGTPPKKAPVALASTTITN
jgi:hypothetical protein